MFLFRDPQPALDDGNHVGEFDRHGLADDHDIGRGDPVCQGQCRPQRLHGIGKGGKRAAQAGTGEVRHGGLGLRQGQCAQVDGHAVETCLADTIELGCSRGLRRGQFIHRPEGLVHM